MVAVAGRRGIAVGTLRIAVSHRVHNWDSWIDGEPSYYDVMFWERVVEYAAESLRKGDRVLVTGRAHTEAWTDSEGVKRTRQVITDAEIGASLQFASVEVVRGPREQSASVS